MGFFLHQHSLEAPLKQMPHDAVQAIEVLGVQTIEVPHPGGEVAVWRFHHQMVVIAHQAIGMHHLIEALADNPKHLQPVQAVIVIKIDILTPIPTRGDVIQRAGKLNPQ
jgi:hypothetical protein